MTLTTRLQPTEPELLKLTMLWQLLLVLLLILEQSLPKLKMILSSLEPKKQLQMTTSELSTKEVMMQTTELHLPDKILMLLLKDSKTNQRLSLMLH